MKDLINNTIKTVDYTLGIFVVLLTYGKFDPMISAAAILLGIVVAVKAVKWAWQ